MSFRVLIIGGPGQVGAAVVRSRSLHGARLAFVFLVYQRATQGLYLKAFDKVEIDSTFKERGEDAQRRRFTFDEEYELDKEGLPEASPGRGTGTIVGLVGFREPYKSTCPRTTDQIIQKLIEHFLLILLEDDCPRVVVTDQGLVNSVNEVFDKEFRATGLAEALIRINEVRNLENEDDRAHLLTLIGLTALRNPDMRKNIRGIVDDVGRMNIATRLQSANTYDESVEEAKAEGVLPDDYDVTYEEMRVAFESGGFKIMLDDNAVISLELQLLDNIMPLLHKRGWHLLRAPEGSSGFITSDRPFYLMWEDTAMRDGPLAPGLAMMGVDIYFPISPMLAVVGAFNVGNTVEDVDEATVAVANSCMPDGAERQVYAPDHKFAYARTREEAPRTGNQLISDKRFLRKA